MSDKKQTYAGLLQLTIMTTKSRGKILLVAVTTPVVTRCSASYICSNACTCLGCLHDSDHDGVGRFFVGHS